MGPELLELAGRCGPSGAFPRLASMASIIATRRLCRSAVHSVDRKTSTIWSARSSARYPAPSVRTFASLCSRAFFAVARSNAMPARTPATLFAAMAEPMPAPSTTMPRPARPEATASAAARAKTG